MATFGLQILLSVVLLSFLRVHVDCKIERYPFHIPEKGTMVNEEVEVNVEDQTEVIRVPQHNDVDAVEVMNDFASGLSVRRVPSTQDCFLSKLDPSLPLPPTMKSDMDQASKQPLLDKVSTKKTITRVLGFAERSALPQKILDFCGNFPINTVEDIPLASVNTSPHKTQDQRRERRHVRRMEYLCSHADIRQLEYCLNKLNGFTFNLKCTMKPANSSPYYAVYCAHHGQYKCDDVYHLYRRGPVVCCRAIC